MSLEYILQIDTSGPWGIVLLAVGGTVVAARRNAAEREHAGTINGMINDVMAETGIRLKDLAAVALCSGPGSYTGLRIGMATAKGLCYALDKPLIMHNKLELLKEHAGPGRLMALLPARNGEYYMAIYDCTGKTLYEPQHAVTEEIWRLLDEEPTLTIGGEAGEDVLNHLKEAHVYHPGNEVDETLWTVKVQSQYNKRIFQSVDSAEPMYLKQVFIQKKKD